MESTWCSGMFAPRVLFFLNWFIKVEKDFGKKIDDASWRGKKLIDIDMKHENMMKVVKWTTIITPIFADEEKKLHPRKYINI